RLRWDFESLRINCLCVTKRLDPVPAAKFNITQARLVVLAHAKVLAFGLPIAADAVQEYDFVVCRGCCSQLGSAVDVKLRQVASVAIERVDQCGLDADQATVSAGNIENVTLGAHFGKGNNAK